MTKILLDTNAYSGFMSGDRLVFEYLVESEIIYLSTVMIGELFAGFHGGNKSSQNKSELKTYQRTAIMGRVVVWLKSLIK